MKRILITEDDALMAEIYRDKLESEGFTAEVAADGAIALQRLKQNPPDLVLLDLMLPSVNGVEVLKFIRSQDATRALPVIVISNCYASSLDQEAVKAGATKCLTKNGCGPRRLLEEVRNVLASTGGVPPTSETATSPASVASSAQLAAPLRPVPNIAPPTPAKDNEPLHPNFSRDASAKMLERLAELRQLLHALTRSDEATRPDCLLALYRCVHGLAGSTAFAGFAQISQMACALEALLKELHAKPKKLNPSSLRTIAQAVDALTFLSKSAGLPQDDTVPDPLLLVVDDEPISRETTCTALEKARLRAISLDDPALALKLVQENRFDLILLDVQMPGLNGFELCTKLHATSTNAKTPVIFLTALNDFETRTRSTLSGGNDFIAKPVMLVELAVKALTHVLRVQSRTGGGATPATG